MRVISRTVLNLALLHIAFAADHYLKKVSATMPRINLEIADQVSQGVAYREETCVLFPAQL